MTRPLTLPRALRAGPSLSQGRGLVMRESPFRIMSFRRRPESRASGIWIPAFAGVTGMGNVL